MYASVTIGALVRRYRHARRLSQTALGAEVGMSQSAISQTEAGAYNLSIDQVHRLVHALAIPAMEVAVALHPAPQAA